LIEAATLHGVTLSCVIAGLDPAISLQRHEMRGSSPRMTM
jgi:hypothetical protein